MNRWIRIWMMALAIGCVLPLALAVRPVAAHEHVIIGEYELTVGWRDEPAVTGSINGLDLGIQHHFTNGTTVWVVGNEGNMTARLTTGPISSPLKALAPQSGRPGWYTFDVIPTRAGSYSVRINGTLEGTAFDQTVPMDDVSPASDLAFPVTDPTASDLQSRLDAANALIAGLQSQVTLAIAIALVGVVVGAVGLVIGGRLARNKGKVP